MALNLCGKSLLDMKSLTAEEILYLIDLAAKFKKLKKEGKPHRFLEGKNIVLIFEKTSTRTRCAFEVAASDLGMGSTYLDPKSSQISKKESIPDTARVLGRMFEGIEYRGFGQSIVEELHEYAGVPVWNGLTDESHPTQMFADFLTIQESFGPDLAGRKFCFMGDAANNVARSLMVTCAKLGLHYVGCGPMAQVPDDAIVTYCKELAQSTGGSVTFTESLEEGPKDADIIYTDIWVSMGEPTELWAERIRLLEPYRVTDEVMAMAKPDAIFLHCLPSFHDLKTTVAREIYREFGIKEMEVTDAVFESPRSKVFDEAENRMHSIKAIMYATLSDGSEMAD